MVGPIPILHIDGITCLRWKLRFHSSTIVFEGAWCRYCFAYTPVNSKMATEKPLLKWKIAYQEEMMEGCLLPDLIDVGIY